MTKRLALLALALLCVVYPTVARAQSLVLTLEDDATIQLLWKADGTDLFNSSPPEPISGGVALKRVAVSIPGIESRWRATDFRLQSKSWTITMNMDTCGQFLVDIAAQVGPLSKLLFGGGGAATASCIASGDDLPTAVIQNTALSATPYAGDVGLQAYPFTGTVSDPGEVPLGLDNSIMDVRFGLDGLAIIRGTLRVEVSDYNATVVKLRQGIGKRNEDGSCCVGTNDGNPPWEGNPYDNLPGGTIYHWGCWLTSLSMALNSEGIHLVPTSYCGPPLTDPAMCPSPVLVPNDPGSLNTFVSKPSMQYGYDANNNIDIDNVVYALSQPSALKNKTNLQFNASYYDCPVSSSCTAAEDFLAGALQQGHPVIVGVGEPAAVGCDQFPCHFVLVWGKRNGEWLIADPWPTIPSATVPPRLKLSDWGHYATRGYLSDPPNSAGLEVTTPSAVELLLIGPTGQRTGYEPTTGAIVQDTGAYFVDSVVDAAETGFATKPSRFVLVPQPADGQYSLEVTGLKLGTYAVNVQGYLQDGSIQPTVTLAGIAGPASTSNFNVQLTMTPGGVSTVVRSPTPASALNDLNNSLSLGLIKNRLIALSLSILLHNAETAQARGNCWGSRDILRLFMAEVKAVEGKVIAPLAAQVLLEDAAYLIAHCGSGCLR